MADAIQRVYVTNPIIVSSQPPANVNVVSPVTISGPITVTFPAVQVVSVNNFPSSFQVSNFPATQAVTGTFFPATQPVSGTVSVGNFPATQPVSGSVSVSNFPASQAVTGAFFPATQPVSGTFWQATQPISGTVGVSNFPATQMVSQVAATLATYSISGDAALVTGATDFFTISGSATKKIKVVSLGFTGLATTAISIPVHVVKRSTANTGGTSVTLVGVPHDSADAAATAVVKQYTVNPTALGTQVGVIRSQMCPFPLAATANAQVVLSPFDFTGLVFSKPLYLNNANEMIAFNLAAAAVAGGAQRCYVTWTEE